METEGEIATGYYSPVLLVFKCRLEHVYVRNDLNVIDPAFWEGRRHFPTRFCLYSYLEPKTPKLEV